MIGNGNPVGVIWFFFNYGGWGRWMWLLQFILGIDIIWVTNRKIRNLEPSDILWWHFDILTFWAIEVFYEKKSGWYRPNYFILYRRNKPKKFKHLTSEASKYVHKLPDLTHVCKVLTAKSFNDTAIMLFYKYERYIFVYVFFFRSESIYLFRNVSLFD